MRKGGGPALEHLALEGDADSVNFSVPMKQHKDCNFSYAGLKTQVRIAIKNGYKCGWYSYICCQLSGQKITGRYCSIFPACCCSPSRRQAGASNSMSTRYRTLHPTSGHFGGCGIKPLRKRTPW